MKTNAIAFTTRWQLQSGVDDNIIVFACQWDSMVGRGRLFTPISELRAYNIVMEGNYGESRKHYRISGYGAEM